MSPRTQAWLPNHILFPFFPKPACSIGHKTARTYSDFCMLPYLFSHFLHTFTPSPPEAIEGTTAWTPRHGATVGSHWAHRLWKVLCQSTPGRVRWGSGSSLHYQGFTPMTKKTLTGSILELKFFCWSHQAGQWWMRTKLHIKFWQIPQAWWCLSLLWSHRPNPGTAWV